MNKSKRVLAMGSALVAIAMMAACAAPIPENGAMPTVTPQGEGAQIPDNPNADAPQGGAPQGPAGARNGEMRAGGFMMDASALDDPDKPANSPAYTGVVVSIEGDQLTILAAPNNPDQDRRSSMEQKIVPLAAGFRVKKAEFERPNSDQDGQRAPGATKLTEITKEQLAKDDRITIWLDESGNAAYAIVMNGFGGNRDGMPQGDRPAGDRQQRRDGNAGQQ